MSESIVTEKDLENYKLSLRPHPHGNTFVVFDWVSKSSLESKRHIKIHENDIQQVN